MLLGRRVRLRPVEKEDLPRFVKWFADPQIRIHLALYMPLSLAQEERWWERNITAGDTQVWAIDAQPPEMAAGPWLHIGSCGFHNIDWRNRVGEAGIVIGAIDQWDRGYGTDALQTLIAWGFYTLNLNRVQVRVNAENARAIRCYEKVGLQVEGRLRQDHFYEGAYHDVLIMAVLRESWDKAAAAVPVS